LHFMAKETVDELNKFMLPYPDQVKAAALWLREFVWDLYPESNELIYVDALSVAIGFSPSDRAGDKFCSVAVHSNHVNFGFNKGAVIADPDKILSGTGLYRFIRVTNVEDFPAEYVKRLLAEAYHNSVVNLNKVWQLTGQTIVKSVSPAASARLLTDY
jgi:hypothetical protein